MSELPCLVKETQLIIDISGGHGGDDGRPGLPLIRYRPWAQRTGSWVVVSNPVHDRVDFMGNSPWGGGSAIIRPDGSVMHHRFYDKEEMIVAEIDPRIADRAEAQRRRNHPLLKPFWDAGAALLKGETIPNTPDVRALQATEREVRIAVAQMACSDKIATNVANVVDLAQQAARREADIVVFPELALTGNRSDVLQSVDQAALEAAVETIASAAKSSKIYVVFGAPWLVDGQRRNCAIVIGDDGQLKTRHAQIAPHREELFQPGQNLKSMWFNLKGAPSHRDRGQRCALD